jgi:hypothetical protein
VAFRFVPESDRLRPPVEAHVRAIYGRTYGAVIRKFPRLMVADVDETGVVRCAAGLRRAADGFFSECYLDSPLESQLGRLAAAAVGRNRIIEVTSLASGSACASARLIGDIVEYARLIGTDWAVFTITPRLKRLLCRIGLPVAVLGPADESRVANPADWGRYYETGPLVAAMQDPGPATLTLSRRSACAAVSRSAGPLEPVHG